MNWIIKFFIYIMEENYIYSWLNKLELRIKEVYYIKNKIFWVDRVEFNIRKLKLKKVIWFYWNKRVYNIISF